MTWHDRQPPWLRVADNYIGTAEIPGRETAPAVARWLRDLRAWWSDDETPWCGVFVAACMREAGVAELPRHWYRARAWLDWGTALDRPVYGCVVVYERAGGGHVGFVVGRDAAGRLMTLGGNQGNRVSVAAFDAARVLGWRWPTARLHLMVDLLLPLHQYGGASSRQEA